MKRSGLITTKIGMTRLFDENGRAHPVTVLSVADCCVIGNRTTEKNGYQANVLGMREAKEKHTNKPQIIAAQKAGVKPYRKVVEFRATLDTLIPVGTKMSAAHFITGQFVDVQATSKGKGFQGGIKRHNFSGLEASHGVLKAHRSLGSVNSGIESARVIKGTKMPGQMGNETLTVQNLKVFGTDLEENFIFVQGAVPGANGSFVLVTDAIKKEQKGLPVPTIVSENETKTVKTEEVEVVEENKEIITETQAEEIVEEVKEESSEKTEQVKE